MRARDGSELAASVAKHLIETELGKFNPVEMNDAYETASSRGSAMSVCRSKSAIPNSSIAFLMALSASGARTAPMHSAF